MKNLCTKRILTALMICLPLCVNAYDFQVDGIYYTLSSSSSTEVYVTYKSSSYNSYSGIVDIPSAVTYGNVTYDVTSIGTYAFYGSTYVTSITIPSSITSIDAYAFYGCTGLTSITIPSNVTSISRYAFYGCI